MTETYDWDAYEWIVFLKAGDGIGGFASKEEAEAWATEHPDEADGIAYVPV